MICIIDLYTNCSPEKNSACAVIINVDKYHLAAHLATQQQYLIYIVYFGAENTVTTCSFRYYSLSFTWMFTYFSDVDVENYMEITWQYLENTEISVCNKQYMIRYENALLSRHLMTLTSIHITGIYIPVIVIDKTWQNPHYL